MAEKEILRIQNFRGINVRASKFIIPDGAAQEAVNFVFEEEGVLSVIRGHKRWNETSLGSGGMQGMTRFYRVGHPPEFIVAHGGKLYKGDDQTKTFSEIKSGLDPDAQVEMKAFRELLFIANGVDRPLKWDGSTVTLAGLDPPQTAPSPSESGSGNLNGTYRWKVTFVSPTHESSGSPSSVSLTVSNKQVTLNNIPTSSDTQVTKRRIYRTLAGGSDFWFVGEINDNTTTTFVDDVPDSGLGAAIPVDKDPPPSGKYLEVFKNRMWMAGVPGYPKRIYFSEFLEPESWPPSYYADIQLPSGDEITGLKVLGETLVVFSRSAPLVIFGETLFDFVIRRTLSNAGTESHRSVVQIENTLVYLSRQGIFAFDGAVSRLLSDDITPLFARYKPGKLAMSAAVYDTQLKRYRVAVYDENFRASTAEPETNNCELIYDLRTGSWSRSSKKIGQYIILSGPGDKGQIFFSDPNDGLLYEDGVGTTFDGQEFGFKWKSKAFAPRSADIPKQWRYLLLWINQADATVGVEVQLNERVIYNGFTFTANALGGGFYGSSQYGDTIYSPPSALARFEGILTRDMVGGIVEILIEGRVPSTAISGPLKIVAAELVYRPLPNIRLKGGN